MGRTYKYPRSPIHWANRKHLLDLLTGEPNETPVSKTTGVYLKPASTNEELRSQYMSPLALELKRKTPMFTK